MSDKKEKPAFQPIYFLHDDIDTVVDERGDSFIALRKVQWARDSSAEPNSEKAKLEIRRWKASPEGEIPNKGLVFLTDEGPHNTVVGLIENGFGKTKDILLKLKERHDFRNAVESLYDESDTSDINGEYFDARELLLDE